MKCAAAQLKGSKVRRSAGEPIRYGRQLDAGIDGGRTGAQAEIEARRACRCAADRRDRASARARTTS